MVSFLSLWGRMGHRFRGDAMTVPTQRDKRQTASAVAGSAAGANRQVRPVTGTDSAPQREVGGPRGPEPVRYGDWEKDGRCIDF